MVPLRYFILVFFASRLFWTFREPSSSKLKHHHDVTKAWTQTWRRTKFTSVDQRTVISERCTGLLLELLSILRLQNLMAIYSTFVHFTVTIFPSRVHNWRDVTFISHIACESCSLGVSGYRRGISVFQGNITADKSQYERMIMRIVSFFWLSFNISQIKAGVFQCTHRAIIIYSTYSVSGATYSTAHDTSTYRGKVHRKI